MSNSPFSSDQSAPADPPAQPPLWVPLFATLLIALGMFGVSAWAWNQIPYDARIPIHWGIDGQPDGYGGKEGALFIMPILAVIVGLILAVCAKMEPRARAVPGSRLACDAIWIGTLLFLGAVHGAMVAIALGAPSDLMNKVIPTGVGALFMLIGLTMGKMRRNGIMGIRVTWTFESDLAWERTHRLGGLLFFALGLASAAVGLTTGLSAIWLRVLGVGLFGSIILLLGYSYAVCKSDPNRRSY